MCDVLGRWPDYLANFLSHFIAISNHYARPISISISSHHRIQMGFAIATGLMGATGNVVAVWGFGFHPMPPFNAQKYKAFVRFHTILMLPDKLI
jgi:hypothetical protein